MAGGVCYIPYVSIEDIDSMLDDFQLTGTFVNFKGYTHERYWKQINAIANVILSMMLSSVYVLNVMGKRPTLQSCCTMYFTLTLYIL